MEIDGKAIAQKIIDELKQKPKIKKFLAAFLVGNDPASISFLKQKEKIAGELGIDFRLYKHPESITSDDLREEIGKITNHKTCGGALIQLPLPKTINAQYVLNAIPREKDIDVLGERALGAFYTGRNPALPPAVGAVDQIIKTYNLQLTNLQTVILGRGVLVGKPIAIWLIRQVAELAVFTSKTENMAKKLKNYDLIITGVGRAGIVKPEHLKEGAGIIDFGYELKDGILRGDLDAANLKDTHSKLPTPNSQLRFYTPSPGGTGPILVAKLFQNFFILNSCDIDITL